MLLEEAVGLGGQAVMNGRIALLLHLQQNHGPFGRAVAVAAKR